MEYYDKTFCLEVWGPYACFTRPELKVERVSYDIITPSAARAIFEDIFWKPAIRWEINRIDVLNPIQWMSVRRNEVGKTASASIGKMKPIYIEDARQQRNALILKDVRYRIWAKMIFIPPKDRKIDDGSHGNDENPKKYQEMFQRRASKGQCFTQPYLGTREFSAYFKFIDEELAGTTASMKPPISETRDFGIMLYDMDFENPQKTMPMFYHPMMKEGSISVPPLGSKDILR